MQPTPDGTPEQPPREPAPPEAATPGPAEAGGAPFPYEPVHPDLLAWARQTLDMKVVLEELHDFEVNGGYSFDEVIAEVEAVVRGS